MKIKIKHWITRSILFECDKDSLKLAIEFAVSQKADLTGADLTWADLREAYLTGAYLRGAYLRGADLRGADLRGADLTGAYLTEAYLTGADLTGAYLTGADLTGAYLTGAYLTGEKLDKEPIQLTGLKYDVLITKQQMKIGCEFHKIKEWFAFDDKRIIEMDGKESLVWWRVYKPILELLWKEHCK